MEKIAVAGIGRLGLCLALNLERVGYHVTGIDINDSYIEAVNNRNYKSYEPYLNEYLASSRNFTATNDSNTIFTNDIQIIFVVVPTPSSTEGSFNHSQIDAFVNLLIEKGKQPITRHIIVNSTTMPGYCQLLEEKIIHLNYRVSYNPEFIAQGSIIHDQQNPDLVLIGESNKEAGDLIENIYKKLCSNHPVFCRMSPLSAEITKLATNCFLTAKIAFANAIGDLAKISGGETDKILNAIGQDSRIGNKYFKYGFGYGGPCFPRDNKALAAFAQHKNYRLHISDATDAANESHSVFLTEQWLNEFADVKQIEFDSVTYKKGTDIIEESQQLKLAVALARAGKNVLIKESETVVNKLKQQFGDLFKYSISN